MPEPKIKTPMKSTLRATTVRTPVNHSKNSTLSTAKSFRQTKTPIANKRKGETSLEGTKKVKK